MIPINLSAKCLTVIYDQFCLGGSKDLLPKPEKVIHREHINEWKYPQNTFVRVKNGYVDSIIRPIKNSKESIERMTILFGKADEIMKSSENEPISHGWHQDGWDIWVADAPERRFEGWFAASQR